MPALSAQWCAVLVLCGMQRGGIRADTPVACTHSCRAWQLFDWVRGLPEGHDLRRLCDVGTYVTMITLCGPWQQLRRALQLVSDMRALSLDAGAQVGLPHPHHSHRHPSHSSA